MEDTPVTILLGTVSASNKNILSTSLFQRAKFYHNTQSALQIVGYVFLKMGKGRNSVKIKISRQNVECSL